MKIIEVEDSIRKIEIYFDFLYEELGYFKNKKNADSLIRSISYTNNEREISIVYEAHDNYLEIYLYRLVKGQKPYGYSIPFRIIGGLELLSIEQKNLYLIYQRKRDFEKMLEIAAYTLKSYLYSNRDR